MASAQEIALSVSEGSPKRELCSNENEPTKESKGHVRKMADLNAWPQNYNPVTAHPRLWKHRHELHSMAANLGVCQVLVLGIVRSVLKRHSLYAIQARTPRVSLVSGLKLSAIECLLQR
jgi:hypothetical protein